jgi:hypothetical protein
VSIATEDADNDVDKGGPPAPVRRRRIQDDEVGDLASSLRPAQHTIALAGRQVGLRRIAEREECAHVASERHTWLTESDFDLRAPGAPNYRQHAVEDLPLLLVLFESEVEELEKVGTGRDPKRV